MRPERDHVTPAEFVIYRRARARVRVRPRSQLVQSEDPGRRLVSLDLAGLFSRDSTVAVGPITFASGQPADWPQLESSRPTR